MSDLLPVASLTQRAERFRCTALNAAMSAGACVDRHTAGREGGRNQHQGAVKIPAYPICAGCSVGAVVLERVGVEPPTDVCAVCGVPVKGARGKRPLCKIHRATDGGGARG